MSNYLICMGFDNLNGDIHYDEKLGLVNINLDTEDTHSSLNFSLNLSQAKVFNEFLANVIASANIQNINENKSDFIDRYCMSIRNCIDIYTRICNGNRRKPSGSKGGRFCLSQVHTSGRTQEHAVFRLLCIKRYRKSSGNCGRKQHRVWTDRKRIIFY